MAEENSSIPMKVIMKVNGVIISKKDMVLKHGKAMRNTKDIIRMDLNMDMVFIHGMMKRNMKESL